MKFEDKLKQLEDIVSALEKGDLPLDKSAELYSKGIELAAQCQKELDDAKLSVKFDEHYQKSSN